jgi:hypothetical protein
LAALGPDRRSGGQDESKTNWENASENASHGGLVSECQGGNGSF